MQVTCDIWHGVDTIVDTTVDTTVDGQLYQISFATQSMGFCECAGVSYRGGSWIHFLCVIKEIVGNF